MLRIVVVNDGIPEVKLETAEVRILRATRQFFERILPNRTDATECNQSARMERHLLRGPIVIRLHLLVVVWDLPPRLAPDVGGR